LNADCTSSSESSSFIGNVSQGWKLNLPPYYLFGRGFAVELNSSKLGFLLSYAFSVIFLDELELLFGFYYYGRAFVDLFLDSEC
jgi:hypothetical protein